MVMCKCSFLLPFLCFLFLIIKIDVFSDGVVLPDDSISLSRNSFPASFIFGTASSSYQYEGAANDGGRGPSIWDTFTQNFPDMIEDHSNGLVATDSYNRYKEDVRLMKDTGFDAYRFSISWSRLLPRGKLCGGVNQEGITYYNNLIDELISNGMQPFVTLFHWDLPQALEDDYGGFLSGQIVNDFKDYAELCYREFGDRVKHWITLNEPQVFSKSGYATGLFAPGRCSKWMSTNCTAGESSVEPYIVGHNQLLAHAAAVKVFRDKYQITQKGKIGIALDSDWFEPLHDTDEDVAAANRAIAFMFGWFVEPLNSGSYPTEMIDYVKERLPKFSNDQSSMIKGSFDFIGLNYYAGKYATVAPCSNLNYLSYTTDSCLQQTDERDGVPIGPKDAASDWLSIYPEGILKLLRYTKEKLNNPVIYITENGIDEVNYGSILLEDNARINYYKDHLSYAQIAITEYDVDLRGYFAWSFLDNFEWNDGYTVRFGIYFVDFNDGCKRYPKSSANWFKMFLQRGNHTRKINRKKSSFRPYVIQQQ